MTETALRPERRIRRRGTTFYASKPTLNDLAVVVKRFQRAESAATDRTFVLVHGIGVSSRYFHPLAEQLAKSGPVYLIDLPGYGSAPNPRSDVSIKDHADVVATFLKMAALDNPVIVGHSMGTQVVSRLVVDDPAVTDRLVLMAPTVNPAERRLRFQALRLMQDTTREPLRATATIFTDYLVRCGVPYFLRQAPHLLGDHMEDRLALVRAKTLVLRGDRDPIVPREWAELVAALVPNSRYAEVTGPHVIMYPDPVGTANLIVRHAA